jgi:hypothetical protein
VTTVISLRGRRDDPDYDPTLNPDVVYLGRRQWWGPGRLLDGHPLANRFSVRKYGRDVALASYRQWLLALPDLDAHLTKLAGKTLACWCKEPDREVACHCDIVAEQIEARGRRNGTGASYAQVRAS